MSDTNTMFLTPDQFVAKLMGQKGATPVSFQSVTDARLRKTGNPLPMPVLKISEVNGFIGYNYETSVNNQRVREGGERDFEAEDRKWGTRIHPCVVEHKGEFYITVKVERSIAPPRYFDAEGSERETVEVKPFLPPKGETRQEVEKEVIHREYKVTSIRNIRWGGHRIEIVVK
jgi:hypothetical protein